MFLSNRSGGSRCVMAVSRSWLDSGVSPVLHSAPSMTILAMMAAPNSCATAVALTHQSLAESFRRSVGRSQNLLNERFIYQIIRCI